MWKCECKTPDHEPKVVLGHVTQHGQKYDKMLCNKCGGYRLYPFKTRKQSAAEKLARWNKSVGGER